MLKKITISILAISLCACLSAVKSPTEQASQKSSDTFKRIDYIETEEDMNAFNKALLRFEHNRKPNELTYSLIKQIERSPKIAKYLVDNKLITLNGQGSRDWISEKAHRTIIQSGIVDPYLKDYWNNVIKQPSPGWYEVKFAVSASVWAANELNDPHSQLMLAKYSMNSCPTFYLVNSRNIHGNKYSKQKANVCNSYPTDAIKWAGKFLSNKQIISNSKHDLIEYMANNYFNWGEYTYAAGYYKLLLDINLKNNQAVKVWDLDNIMTLKEKLNAGGSIENYLKSIDGNFDNKEQRLERAYRRLDLIRLSGVKTFDDYGLQ